MSFDVFLQRFETGQSAQVNREQVLAVLKATKRSLRFCFLVDTKDGRTIVTEYYAKIVGSKVTAANASCRTALDGQLFLLRS